jgi:hypothetical protein
MKNNIIQLYRYTWVKNQINLKNIGLEIGSKSEFSKNIIDSSIFFLSGNKDDYFLDFKNVNYFDTDFNDSTFDYLLISDLELNNLEIDLFYSEMFRILKKNGRLIIIEENNSSWFKSKKKKHLKFLNKNYFQNDQCWYGENILINISLLINQKKQKNSVRFFRMLNKIDKNFSILTFNFFAKSRFSIYIKVTSP